MKRAVIYWMLFVSSLVLSYFWLHNKSIKSDDLMVLPVRATHLFSLVSSVAIIFTLYLLSRKENYKDSLGYIYLATVLLKPVIFLILFGSVIFNENSLSKWQAFTLILPLLIGLFFEVIICAQLLNQLNSKKKPIKG
ncbi:MAG: DUF6168 family protein [bacterium]